MKPPIIANIPSDKLLRALIHETEDYRPVGELMVTAHALLEEAEDSKDHARQIRMGALFTLASSVEAFCQTLGPRILEDIWSGRKNVERAGVMKKLELLAKRLNVPGFDASVEPWKSVKVLMDARHQLAHPKPEPVERTYEIITSQGLMNDDVQRVELLWDNRYPILAKGSLKKIAEQVIIALDSLLQADKQDSSMLTALSESTIKVEWRIPSGV